jgi:hypothetical protein
MIKGDWLAFVALQREAAVLLVTFLMSYRVQVADKIFRTLLTNKKQENCTKNTASNLFKPHYFREIGAESKKFKNQGAVLVQAQIFPYKSTKASSIS